MELGEAVAVQMLGKDACTFCAEAKKEKTETKEITEDNTTDTSDADAADDQECTLHNDSGALATALGGQPFALIDNPPSARFWKGYRVKAQSRVCGNAHHVIPGNASLAKCAAVLKWMAKTVKVTKVRYKSVESQVQDGEEHPEEGVTVRTTVTKTKTGKKVETVKEVDGKVTGAVDYDLNGAGNGVWLPSNNAVYRWKRTSPAFKAVYAQRAMGSSSPPRQFHDAHPAYSDEVLKQLGNIEMVVKKKAEACVTGEHGAANDDGLLPAPQKLAGALDRLSQVLMMKLVGSPVRWREPYNTSDFALTSKPPVVT